MHIIENLSDYSDRVAEIRQLRIQGNFAEAQVLLDSISSAHTLQLETDELAQLQYEKGCLFLGQGDHVEANRVFEELLSEDQLKTTLRAGLGFNGLGLSALTSGHHSEALDFFRKSLVIFELVDYRKGIAAVLGNLSECLLELGEVSQAKIYIQRALQISERNNHMYGVAWSQAGLGILLAAENRLKESQKTFLHALELFKSLKIEKVWVLCEAAEAFILTSEFDFAEQLLERASHVARNGPKGELARVQLHWGILEFERGNLGLASHHFQRALSRSDAVKVRARAYLQMARVHLSKYRSSELKDYAIDEVEYFVDQALALAEKPTPRIPLIIEISLVKAGLAESQMDFDRAISVLQEAEDLSQTIEIPTLSRKVQDQLSQAKRKKKNLLRLMMLAEGKGPNNDREISQDDAKTYLEEILRIVGRGPG